MGKVKFATLHAGLLLRECGPNVDDEDDINQPDGHMGGDPDPVTPAPAETPVEVQASDAAPPPAMRDTPPTATPGHPPAPDDTGPTDTARATVPTTMTTAAERPLPAPGLGSAGRKVPPLAQGKVFGRRNRPPSPEEAAAPTLSLAGAREAVAAQILKRRPRGAKSRRRAMTLRLDPDRHHRLRDISDRLHRSCQSILTEALDDFITVHASERPLKKT